MKRLMTGAAMVLLSNPLSTLANSASPGEARIPQFFKHWRPVLKKPAQGPGLPTMAPEADTPGNEPLPSLQSPTLTIFFHTGSDQVTDRGRQKLAELSHILHRYPRLQARLNGHADPRGTDGYNNVLSQYRVRHAAAVLESRGIDTGRLEIRAFGTDKSRAPRGDHHAYAMERRVTVELRPPAGPAAQLRQF